MPERTMSGGCQCGRVRYSGKVAPDAAYLCHCRMCQRATGSAAGHFVSVERAKIRFEEEPDWYDSSPIARRGFCSACGSPIAFQYKDDLDWIHLSVGTFDKPRAFVPRTHYGV